MEAKYAVAQNGLLLPVKEWNHEKSYFLQSVKQPKWWSPNAVPKQIGA